MAGFKKASRASQYVRMAIQGASGSGKTRSALEIAKHLAKGGPIALIDTERSAALYSDVVDFDVDDDFGPIGKESYAVEKWKEKLINAAQAGYKVVVLDSATHLWKGPGGFLSEIDVIGANQRARGGKVDTFSAWKTVDPRYMAFMQFIRALPMHVIFCIRAKTEYERTTDGKGGLKKVGMAPEYREGYEYEFDIQTAIDMDHTLVPLKHRLGDVLDGKVFPKPGKDFAEAILGWLTSDAAEETNAKLAAEIAKKAAESAETPKAAVVKEPTADEVAESRAETSAALDPTTIAQAFSARMIAAQSVAELQAMVPELAAAKKDGTITADEHKSLGKTYTDAKKRLEGAAA